MRQQMHNLVKAGYATTSKSNRKVLKKKLSSPPLQEQKQKKISKNKVNADKSKALDSLVSQKMKNKTCSKDIEVNFNLLRY